MTDRKNAAALTPAEQQRYVSGITALNGGPAPTAYGRLVADHALMSHNMHGMTAVGRQRFLSWHRDFLLQLERALQALDPLAFVPYWRWSTYRRIPAWIAQLLPTVHIPPVGGQGPQTVNVTRSTHHVQGLPTASQIASLDANTAMPYTQFTTLLEGYHNVVHGWVGGTMNNIMISPADPIFWLHHAEVDRIWSVWQANPANAGKAPTLTGSAKVMDPWPESAAQLASIQALGYSYS